MEQPAIARRCRRLFYFFWILAENQKVLDMWEFVSFSVLSRGGWHNSYWHSVSQLLLLCLALVREQELPLCSGNRYWSWTWKFWTESHLASDELISTLCRYQLICVKPSPTLLFFIFQCLGNLLVEPQAKKEKIQVEQRWNFFMKL